MHNEQNDIFLAYYSSYFNFRCLVEIKHTHSATIWSTIILQTFRAQRNVQKQCNTSKKEHYYAIYSATGIGKKTENRRNLGSLHFRTNRKTGWSWFILWSCHQLLHIGPLAANSSEITNVPLGVHYWGRGFLVNFLKCSKYSCIIAFTTGKKHRSIRDWKMKISWIDRIYLTPSYGSYGTFFLFLLFFVFSLFYISLTSL